MCPPRDYFPVLCKFWQLYGRVKGNLLPEYLCHTHTQSPCPYSRPLLTCTSTGDSQTQFCLSLCGVPGSWCAQGLFEPSECLWQEWSLILNMILHLLPSCFSFSLGQEVSPHSCSSAYHLTGVFLTLDVWYLYMAISAKHTVTAPDLGHGISPLGHLLLKRRAAATMHMYL